MKASERIEQIRKLLMKGRSSYSSDDSIRGGRICGKAFTHELWVYIAAIMVYLDEQAETQAESTQDPSGSGPVAGGKPE